MVPLNRALGRVPRPVRAVQPARRSAVACHAKAATVSDTRKTLAQRGWDRAWIDGVTERIYRKQVTCSIEEMNAVVRFADTSPSCIKTMCRVSGAIFDRMYQDTLICLVDGPPCYVG